MLDPQPVNFYVFISSLILLGFVTGMVWMYFHFRRNEKMADTINYIRDKLTREEGSPVVALAMLANGLPRGKDRSWAITSLVTLATSYGRSEALLALRDHIKPKDLQRALKSWDDGDLKWCLKGNEIGKLNGEKIICFAVGIRPIGFLDSDLTRIEIAMLRDRFGVYHASEVFRSSTG